MSIRQSRQDEYNWTFRTDLELKGTKIASKSLIGQQMRQENRFEATKSDFCLARKLLNCGNWWVSKRFTAPNTVIRLQTTGLWSGCNLCQVERLWLDAWTWNIWTRSVIAFAIKVTKEKIFFFYLFNLNKSMMAQIISKTSLWHSSLCNNSVNI